MTMFSDYEIESLIEEEISRGDHDAELLEEWALLDFDPAVEPKDVDLDALIEEYEFYQVACRYGCGIRALGDTEILSIDPSQGTASFRCLLCNEIQTAELLILD
jgi:hypothetical protein